MQRVQRAIDRRTEEFAGHPFFAYLSDHRIDARQRLAFAPALAHFVMTFADIYRLVLREEPAKDEYQEVVNAHTYEDGGHWKWFLADLGKMGHDPKVSFSDALRFVWSDATTKSRMLSYTVCRLGLGASSLQKLVLVQCIEASGAVTLGHIAAASKELGGAPGKNLVYFGSHHVETEADHTLEKDDVRAAMERNELGGPVARDLVSLVDECFVLFKETADELLAFSTSASSGA